MLMMLSQQFLTAQTKLSGSVTDAETKTAVASATIELNRLVVTTTGSDGSFRFTIPGKGKIVLKVSAIGFKPWEQEVELSNGSKQLSIQLEKQILFLQPLEIMAIRAGDRMPFTKTNLNKAEIEKMNSGADLPFILNQTPSVIVNSDAGNGIGYTGIRIRGTDATRINMMINGIPYNDAESQGLFFVNLPDFSSSVNSIQIQRGVGTSSNGAGAFGATMNLSTNEFREKKYAELSTNAGSFNSIRTTLKAGSGLIGQHFTIDGRISAISSNGFVDRASSNLKSAFLSAAYINKKTSIRLNVITGKEKTYQAWNGIPEAKLKGNLALLETHYWNNYDAYSTREDSLNLFDANNNRTYNSFLYKNQTDNYQQNHYQFFITHELNKQWSFNTAFFLTRGKGYYEEYKRNQELGEYGLSNAGSADLIRQLWLNNWFYGNTFSVQYKKEKDLLTIGGVYTQYKGLHYGKIIWSTATVPKDYKWYNLDAFKNDFSFYTKYQRRLAPRWEAFADVQYRNVDYRINGFRKTPNLILHNQFNFLNPKLGISYADTKGWLGYASFSIGNKEPNREDFETAETKQPKHETLYDFELNIEQRKANYSWSITGYYMKYKNQLVLTGGINDVGAYTRINIPESYRAGIELQGTVKPVYWFNATANLTLSENKVKNFTELIDDYDNGGQKENFFSSSSLSFSPSVIGGVTLNFVPVKNGEISFMNKYISRQFLDNTGNKTRSIDPYFVSDLLMSYHYNMHWNQWFKNSKLVQQIHLNFRINNVLNKKYEANGYTFNYFYGGQTIAENYYYPMAGRNFMLGVSLKL